MSEGEAPAENEPEKNHTLFSSGKGETEKLLEILLLGKKLCKY